MEFAFTGNWMVFSFGIALKLLPVGANQLQSQRREFNPYATLKHPNYQELPDNRRRRDTE
jgi:hypothetical protein